MAVVRRYSASGQSGISQNINRPVPMQSDAVARATQKLGQTISGVGQQIDRKVEEARKQEKVLFQKHRDMLDKTGMMKVDFYMENEEETLKNQKSDDGDVRKWQDFVNNRAKTLTARVNNLDLSDEAREIADIKLDAWLEKNLITTQGDVISKDQAEHVAMLKETFAGASRVAGEEMAGDSYSGEGMELTSRMYGYAVDQVHDSDEYTSLPERLQMFEEGRNKFKSGAMDAAASNPEKVISNMKAEQKLRKTDKGRLSDKLLTDKDLRDVMKYARTNIIDISAKVKLEANKKIGTASTELFELINKGEADATAINNYEIDVPVEYGDEIVAMKENMLGVLNKRNTRIEKASYDPPILKRIQGMVDTADSQVEFNNVNSAIGKAEFDGKINREQSEDLVASINNKIAPVAKAISKPIFEATSDKLLGEYSQKMGEYLQPYMISSVGLPKQERDRIRKEAIDTYGKLQPAKTWASGILWFEFDRMGREVTPGTNLDDHTDKMMRFAAIWMSKDDEQIVKEYKEWIEKSIKVHNDNAGDR